ncbi:MAG: hypothetical protein ACJ71G_09040 [Nitrososphaeraceae archaeon]
MMMNNMDGSMGGMMMMMGSSPNTSNSISGSTMNQLAMTNDNNNGDSNRTLNITAYQQAQGLAMRALQIFNNDLKPTSLVNDSSSSSSSANGSPASTNTTMSNAINKIENNLIRLKDAIESKAPVMDVMKIVHGDIHPTLLISYKLQLRR